jgi:hypothetical protein
MKRLVWLLLTLSTLAFAQVQPVVVLEQPADACDCCEPAGACDMPDCAPPPAQVVVAVDRPAAEMRAENRQTVKRKVPAPAKFYSALVESANLSTGSIAMAAPLPPANVPLYAAHCRFLI